MLTMLNDLPTAYYGVSLFGIGILTYYLFDAVKPPLLACAEGPYRKFVEEHVHIVKNRYWPTFWCFESTAHTILASALRKIVLPKMNYRREILTLKDGGEVALDWADHNCSPTSPIVIILPGLTGSSQADYVKCLVLAAKSAGIRCMVMNYRGLGGVALKTPRLYCAANFEDFIEGLSHVKKLYPNVPLGATGISMGGLILGNYLAHSGESAAKELKAAFVISPPWNINEAVKNLKRTYLNSLLDAYLAESLCRVMKKHYTAGELKFANVDYDTLFKSKTVKEFDANFTAKHFGYKDVEHYYENATLHNKLHKIKLPLLCLSAADDPMQPLIGIPVQEANKSENVALLVTARGGHIGFLEGFFPLGHESYMGKIFAQYFTGVFHKMDTALF